MFLIAILDNNENNKKEGKALVQIWCNTKDHVLPVSGELVAGIKTDWVYEQQMWYLV